MIDVRARVTDITKRLVDVTSVRWDKRGVFMDWLELLDSRVTKLEDVGSHTGFIEREGFPWTTALEKYGEHDLKQLCEAMEIVLASTMDEGEPTYRDLLGPVFMDVGSPGPGQFFTPWEIAKMMAQMQMGDLRGELVSRIKAAIDKSPAATALAMAELITMTSMTEGRSAMLEKVIPMALEHFDPITVCDPCCGSGTMLLASASCFPAWVVQGGLIRFFGQDLDATCVKMAKINCKLYGLR